MPTEREPRGLCQWPGCNLPEYCGTGPENGYQLLCERHFDRHVRQWREKHANAESGEKAKEGESDA
jgi:hypothetical protein